MGAGAGVDAGVGLEWFLVFQVLVFWVLWVLVFWVLRVLVFWVLVFWALVLWVLDTDAGAWVLRIS
jgi:hypothetical protein